MYADTGVDVKMAHDILTYGLIGFFSVLAIIIAIYFVTKPLLIHVEYENKIYMIGAVIVIGFGVAFGNLLSGPVCWGTPFVWLCTPLVYFISIIGLLIAGWRLFIYRAKDFV